MMPFSMWPVASGRGSGADWSPLAGSPATSGSQPGSMVLEPAFPLDSLPAPAPLPPGSRMPLARNPLFVGREADLLRLARALRGGGTAAIGPQAAVATGLGGLGKTQ